MGEEQRAHGIDGMAHLGRAALSDAVLLEAQLPWPPSSYCIVAIILLHTCLSFQRQNQHLA